MQTKNQKKFRTLLLSIFFFIVPALIWILWIYVFETNSTASYEEKVKIYNSFLPEFMHNDTHLSLTVLISLVAAIVFASLSMRKAPALYKAIGVIIIIISLLIMLLQLFSMM
ncbi:MAG TPA: hypothetical protein VFW07_25825 [Parafilimonas sp.]|nr:hypothetical protein [Parafilimonas sp.]